MTVDRIALERLSTDTVRDDDYRLDDDADYTRWTETKRAVFKGY